MTFREETLSKEALKAFKNAKNKSDFLRSAIEFYVGFKDSKTHDTHSTNGNEFESLKSLVYELIEKLGTNSDVKKPLSEVDKKHSKQEKPKKLNVVESIIETDEIVVPSFPVNTIKPTETVASFKTESVAFKSTVGNDDRTVHELSEVELLVSNSIAMFGDDDED